MHSEEKLRELRREAKRLREELREANARATALLALSEAPRIPRILRAERGTDVREMAAVVLGSDWHVEEKVSRASCLGRNYYSLEVADKRITKFFDAIIWGVLHHRASKRVVVRDIILGLLGDLMSGYIHEEMLENNELSPVETLLWLQPRIETGIARILKALDPRRLVIPWSYGNHGRTTPERRISTGHSNSYEWLLGNTLQRRNTDPRVEYVVTPSAHQYVEVYGQLLHFTHGDEVRLGMGPALPFAAINRRVAVWESVVPAAKLHHFGHHHRLCDLGHTVVNGSLIGYNAYAMNVGAPFEEPQQAFYLLDSERGKCAGMPIWVDAKQ